jgi:hypothetical protein
MRTLCVLLLLCLVAAGPAAAIAVNPASMPAVAKVTTAIPPPALSMVQRTLAGPPVVTPRPTGTLQLVSAPAGASVSVDGFTQGTTPFSGEIPAGSHTVNVSLAGYKTYSNTVTIPAQGMLSITIELERAPLAAVRHEEIAVAGTGLTPKAINRTIIPGAFATQVPPVICTSGQQCLTTADAAAVYAPGWYYKVTDICGYVVSANNPTIPKYCTKGELLSNPPVICTSDQKCLTLDGAAAAFAPGWWYKEGDICGYEVSATGTVPKYCTEGSPKLKAQQAGVHALVSVLPANPANITGQAVLPDQTPRVLGAKRQVGVIDSVFGFFNGLFSHPVCPAGKTACGSSCVDLMNDSLNCGSCDYTCFDPAVCIAGECDYAPPPWSNPYDDLLL